MRWLLGCLGIVFIIFGGCVLAIFSQGVASDEAVFAIGALVAMTIAFRRRRQRQQVDQG